MQVYDTLIIGAVIRRWAMLCKKATLSSARKTRFATPAFICRLKVLNTASIHKKHFKYFK